MATDEGEIILAKLAEVTAAVHSSCAAYRRIMSARRQRSTTLSDVEAAETLAWAAHRQLHGLLEVHGLMHGEVKKVLVEAGAPGWYAKFGSIFREASEEVG